MPSVFVRTKMRKYSGKNYEVRGDRLYYDIRGVGMAPPPNTAVHKALFNGQRFRSLIHVFTTWYYIAAVVFWTRKNFTTVATGCLYPPPPPSIPQILIISGHFRIVVNAPGRDTQTRWRFIIFLGPRKIKKRQPRKLYPANLPNLRENA